MITQVHLKNFRCFRDVTVGLDPFTVLIGKNDTGKSSFLQAVGRACSDRWDLDASQEWWSRSVAFGSEKNDLQLDLTLDGGEKLKVRFGQSNVYGTLPTTTEHLRPHFFHAVSKLSKLTAERLSQVKGGYRLSPDVLRQAHPVGAEFANKPLGQRGEGLSAILDRVLSENRERFDSIETSLRERVPTIEYLRLRPVSQANRKVVGIDLRNGAKLSADDLSDGLLLMLAYLVIANDEYCPPVLSVEEPENGIHPKQLREVLRLLFSLTQREINPIQVIITTHSPYVLDFVPATSVRVFRRDKESGDVEVVPFAEMAPIKEMLADGYTPGEAWYNSDEDHLHEELPKNASPRAK